jgi:hypothetical protein
LKVVPASMASSLARLSSSWLTTSGSAAPLQPAHLRRVHVGHAQVADLAGGLEAAEGVGDLGGLHQRVGAVQQQDVELLHAQALQDAVDAGLDVGGAQVVAADVLSSAKRMPHLLCSRIGAQRGLRRAPRRTRPRPCRGGRCRRGRRA